MKLMTTKAGPDGMETHISYRFLVLIFFVLVVVIEFTSIWPPVTNEIEYKSVSQLVCEQKLT